MPKKGKSYKSVTCKDTPKNCERKKRAAFKKKQEKLRNKAGRYA